MPYSLENRLVIGVASSALFDLAASDEVFRTQGEEAYRRYQEENSDTPLEPGVAFPFIKRLLSTYVPPLASQPRPVTPL
jgi:5'-nucleotidase